VLALKGPSSPERTAPPRQLATFAASQAAWRRNDMNIQWRHDPDAALEEAKRKRQPVLIDFTAAPM